MADYRKTVYLGAGPDGERLSAMIEKYGAMKEFRESEMEFMRHCILYAINHDPLIKKMNGSR